jgi:membrane glycosyltransferase
MLGLISTPDPRYGGAPDPDEERERRWEPINWRISVSMTLSLLCLIVSGTTPDLVTIALNVAAVLLCLYGMRVAWPSPQRDADDGADSLDA